MSDDSDLDAAEPLREGKYARIERERRFLLNEAPSATAGPTVRRITDRYLTGTRLRLRLVQREDTTANEYTLTQKVPSPRRGGTQGLITNTYLNQVEYELLASLPAVIVAKTRISVPPLGIDMFHGALDGLVMAEAEFSSDTDCHSFIPPTYCLAEVTDDARFTGVRLAHAGRSELLGWLAEFGIEPVSPS